MKLAQVGACVILAEQALAGSHEAKWNKKKGMCKKDVDGTKTGGEAGTDYIAHERVTVDSVAHCQELCVAWQEMTGSACHAIEYQSGDAFGYCEFWGTEPTFWEDTGSHTCSKMDSEGAFTENVGACRVTNGGTEADKGVAGTDYIRLKNSNGGDKSTRKMVLNEEHCKKMCNDWETDHSADDGGDGTACHGIEVEEAGDDPDDPHGLTIGYCKVWMVEAEGEEGEDNADSKISCESRKKPPPASNDQGGEGAPQIGARSTNSTPELDASGALTKRAFVGVFGSAMAAMVVV